MCVGAAKSTTMSALNVCHDSSIPVGSLIHMCVVTHLHVRVRGQLNCSVSTMCAMTHPYMCHNSSISASPYIHERACAAQSTANMCHNSSICASQFVHAATHCNTLQHTATHCNTLQHTATHCNTIRSRMRRRGQLNS